MILFASESNWLHFSDSTVTAVAAFAKLHEPAVVVWHPQRGVTGVASLEGNVRHAAVLIERRLRSEGGIEGETKVFVHHIRQIGQGYQALYTVAPLDEWQRLLAWANGQPHHCLLLSSTALLWSKHKPGTAVVFHNGTQLTFLGMLDGQIFQVNTIAFGNSKEDLQFAAGALGERVLEEIARLNLDSHKAGLEVLWFSVCYEAQADAQMDLSGTFSSASHLRVTPMSKPLKNVDDGAEVWSAIPVLAQGASARLSLNSAADKWMFWADKFLPVCAIASFVFALSTLFVSVGWLAQSRQTSQKIEALQLRELEARNRTASVQAAKKVPADFTEQMVFIDTVRKLETGHDLAAILQALKAASRQEVRILGVRTEEATTEKKAPDRAGMESVAAQKTSRIVVDGILADSAVSQDSQLLSFFVRTLREQGYQAEPIDTKNASATLSASSRLFSYKLSRMGDSREVHQ